MLDDQNPLVLVLFGWFLHPFISYIYSELCLIGEENTDERATKRTANVKDDIDDLTAHCVREGKGLKEVETLLKAEFSCELSEHDLSYVEDLYTELLIGQWLEEAHKHIADHSDPSLIVVLIQKVNDVRNFVDCYALIDGSFSNLIKELHTTSRKLKFQEKQCVFQFREICLNQLLLQADNVKNELNFFQCFVDILKSSKDLDQLCSALNLSSFLQNDKNDDISFKEFLLNLQKCNFQGENFTTVKYEGSVLFKQDKYFFIKSLKETVNDYLKPVTIYKSLTDGRELLEVSGKHIVISAVLTEIENVPMFLNIEEVRFINVGVIHVDTDFSASNWHGKNIVVFGESLIVDDKGVTWNVSGMDAKETAEQEAGTANDGTGLIGTDGKSGESGGNVLVMVDYLKNGHNLKIISNGGKGSKGQDGGRGQDGKDGEGIDVIKFKKDFPPVSKLSYKEKLQRLLKTIKNISNIIQEVKELNCGGNKLDCISNIDFHKILNTCITDLSNIYFEVKTKTGCEIIFSFYNGDWFYSCQSLLMYKGSNGDNGQSGGVGGVGGRGGFAGCINIKVAQNNQVNIIECAVNGKEGERGKMGMFGKPGKNGSDVAYLDSTNTIWGNEWPKIYSSHLEGNKRLTLTFHKEYDKDRVYCPHNDLYAKVFEVKKQINVKHNHSNDLKHIDHRREVQVRRKKTISPENIMEQYKQKSSILDLYKVNNALEQARAMAEKIISDPTLQSKYVDAKVKVTRKHLQENYFTDVLYTHESSTILETERIYSEFSKEVPSAQLIELVCSAPKDVHNWTKLMQARLNLQQLDNLWETTNVSALLTLNEKLDKILKIVFCNKYQLAVLEYVETTCLENPEYQRSLKNISDGGIKLNYTISDNFKYILTINNDQKLFNDVEKYLCDDSKDKRLEIKKMCEESVIDENVLRNSKNTLISEFGGDSSDGLEIVEMVHKVCNICKMKKNVALKTKLVPFKNELMKAELNELYNLLIESVVNQNICKMVEFHTEIQKDKFLSSLYIAYVKEAVKQYNWNHCEEKRLTDAFYKFVQEKGPFGAFYRELLAYHFEKNILLFHLNKKNEIVLAESHNPKAKAAVYVLLKDEKFIKLDFNCDLATMFEEHKVRAALYSRILLHIGSYSEKQQFDNFISKNPFASRAYKSIDKSQGISVMIKHILAEEDYVRAITDSFRSDKDKALVNSRLGKLKLEYIGYANILHYMALHFNSEGNHMSAKELCFIINFVLQSSINPTYTLPLISWIIASYHQTEWLVELALLKLELYFKQSIDNESKSRWRKYIRNQSEKDVLMLFLEKLGDNNCNVSKQCVDEVLFLLSNIPKGHVFLTQLDLSEWKYYLKDKYWAYQVNTTADWSNDQLKLASYYLVAIENSLGTDVCDKIIGVTKRHSAEIKSEIEKENVLNILKILTNMDICIDKLLQDLSSSSIYHWQQKVEDNSFSTSGERTLLELVELIKNSGNTSADILKSLNDIVNAVEISNAVINILEKKIDNSNLEQCVSNILQALTDSPDDNLSVLHRLGQSMVSGRPPPKDLKAGNNIFQNLLGEFKQGKYDWEVVILATVVTAINIKLGIKLRATQKLAIMTLFKSNKSILGQVSTGEGKSLIVVSLAIMKALRGQKVDVITSSHVLAERDAQLYKDIYNLFRVTVGHNCSEHTEERKKAYSNCQVVYGELANFQRDYLSDRVYDKNILGDRTFEAIIVDEVDSMLLDKGNNVLYLSHEIPGLDKLEPLFLYIWKCLNRPVKTDQPETVFNVAGLKERLLYEMYGRIKIENIRDLDTSLTGNEVNDAWKYLVEKEIISSSGNFLKQDSLTDLENGYRDHLTYFMEKVSQREKHFEIPNYLKPFVEIHLEEWIKNGIKAMSMDNGKDYVVDVDRSGTSSDRNPNITIVDRDTGTDMVNSQWDDGLHQFLQLKHGCKLSPISLKAVFISNVSYLKLYEKLHGLTGTLGSNRERELLKEVYEVGFVTIPTARAKLLIENISIVCSSTDDWSTTIIEEVCNVIKKKRSALIICETVNEVLFLKKKFFPLREKIPLSQIHTYTRDYEDLDVANNLQPGHIIISTNLAGRGTDIKLSSELIDAGGLHVCLSFLPSNQRIEEQALGRTARNGNRGTSQLIFKSISLNCASKIIDLKKQRDKDELYRITDIKKYYEVQIQPEEEYFKKFREVYDHLKGSKHQDDVKLILLQTCLDQWSFWLDKNTKFIASVSKNFCFNDMLKLCEKAFSIWSNQVEDPVQLIKLGLYYLNAKDNKTAILLFNRVIEKEPSFSEAAYYYRICAKAASEDLNIKDLYGDLEIVERQLKDRIKSSLLSAHVIHWLKDRNTNSILQIDSFKEQQINVSNIYNTYLQSIYDVVGNQVTPESFLIPTLIDEQTAHRFYNDLVEEKVIQPQTKVNLTERDLTFVMQYGLTPKDMCNSLIHYVGKRFDEQKVLKELKTRLPSRELFWENLKHEGILGKEEKYAVVDFQKLNRLDPSLAKVIKPLEVDISLIHDLANNKIWIYTPEELGYLAKKCTHSICKRDELKKKISDEKYKLLKIRGIIFINKQATVQGLLEHVKFKEFDSITEKDFEKLGITDTVPYKIIHELKEKYVIRETTKGCESEYSLLINPANICDIELSTYKAYSDDVKRLLSFCFAFRIALEKFKYLLTNQMRDEQFCLPLPSKLHKCIISELKEEGVVTMSVVDPKISGVTVLRKLYTQFMNKEGYNKIFNKLYNDEMRGKIINDLIKKEWLIICKSLFSSENPDKLLYSINCKKQNKDKNFELVKPHKLNSDLDCYTETIELILLNQLKQTNIVSQTYKTIENILENCEGTFHKVETPSFSLIPLLNVLQEKKIPTSEYDVFSLNGFDLLLVLMEKKWTRNMKKNLFMVVMLGVTEITVGTALSLCLAQPLGCIAVGEGINDLIFAISCMFSGHCTWNDFSFNKLLSLTIAVLSSFSSFTNMFQSKFGEKTSGFSFGYLKQKCSNAFGKVTNYFKNLLGMSKPLDKSLLVKSVAKKVVASSAEGITRGIVYSSIDHLIAPQLEKVGETITEVIYSNIDESIHSHPVSESVEKLYRKFGKKESEKLINFCFSTIMKEYTLTNDKNWERTVNVVNTIIKQNISTFNTQADNKKLNSDMELYMNIYKIVTNVIEVVKVGHSYHTQIKSMVSDILNNIEQKLQEKLNVVEEMEKYEIKETNLKNLTCDTLVRLGKDIKSILSDHINRKILSPVLHSTGHYLLTYSSQMMSKKFNSFFTDEEVNELNKFKNHWLQSKESSFIKQLKTSSFVDSEYDECLLGLLNLKRNVFVDVLKKNIAVDENWIQLCCLVVPMALRREGIEIPGLEIIVERDGIQEKLCTAGTKPDALTIIIAPEADLITNIKKNKILITDLFDAIYSGVLQCHPQLNGFTAEALRAIVISAVEHSSDIQQFIKQLLEDKPTREPTSQLNTQVEKSSPYQHSHSDGSWVFNPTLDVDLRGKEKLSYLNQIEDHLLKGFKTAIEKINNHIYKVQDYLKPPFKLVLGDFSEIKHDIFPQTCNAPKSMMFHVYAIQYKLVIPFKVKDNYLVNFTVTISLKSQVRKTQPRCPSGPHIVYEISPLNDLRYLDKGVKGHILLGVECKDYSYSVKDCHVAGELILPTGFRLKDSIKNCEVLILGDSMFEYISQYITERNFEGKSYPSTNKLKSEIAALVNSYRGIRCVVLYIGTSCVKSNITEDEIASDIEGVVTEIQSHLNNAKIILCSLIYRKNWKGRKYNKKISNINSRLQIFSEKMNLEYLETNNVVGHQDLRRDGVHLNRHGYHKLGHRISDVCKFYVKHKGCQTQNDNVN